uniref:Expressed conserved protein n=1 Tax=Echinococcus granulosus TaxID=6210 RepID=A0A068WIG8_ECHGR|nr:hypothetical protein EgrG_001015400 [Echinococcus granulosus]
MGALHSVNKHGMPTKIIESNVKGSGLKSFDQKTNNHQVDSNPTRVPNNSQNKTDSLRTDPSLIGSPLDTPINSRNVGKYSEVKKPQRPSRDAEVRRSKSTNVSPTGTHKKNVRPRQENTIQSSITTHGRDQNMLSKFIQAGVGYAFMRDNETNTIQPIFPSNTPVGVKKCGLNPSIATPCSSSGQAYGDEDKAPDDVVARKKQVHAVDESGSGTRLRACARAVNIVALDDGDSKYQNTMYPKGDTNTKSIKEQSYPSKIQRDNHVFNPNSQECQKNWISFNQNGVKKQSANPGLCCRSSSPTLRRKLSDPKNDTTLYKASKKPIYSLASPKVVSRHNLVAQSVGRRGSKSPRRTKNRSPPTRAKACTLQSPPQPNKFRFFLKETEEINNMLNDPDDRRIRTICERFQCDLDIYAKNLIGGFMQYTVDIAAPNASSLLGCVKNLDSALGWHIAPQLNSGNNQK